MWCECEMWNVKWNVKCKNTVPCEMWNVKNVVNQGVKFA